MIEAFTIYYGGKSETVAKCPDKPTDEQWQEFETICRTYDWTHFRLVKKRSETFSYARLCPTCKRVVLVNRSVGGKRRYCSDECRLQTTEPETRSQKHQATCKKCGNTFATSRVDAKYCSAKCRVAWNRAK
jgi:hypothetical protein